MSHNNHSAHGNGLGHILPYNVYVSVFVALIVLTVITVAASQVYFGTMNVIVALVIASIKATLVALFFMHLKYESPVTWLFASFPLILLAIMLAGIFIDNPYRIIPEPVKVIAPAK